MEKRKKKEVELLFFDPIILEYVNCSPLQLFELQTDDYSLGKKEWKILERVGLSPRQTECIWLYYYEQLTQSSIARLLGVSQPAVALYLRNAKRRIARHLGYRWF